VEPDRQADWIEELNRPPGLSPTEVTQDVVDEEMALFQQASQALA
jgi:hypothetical protein